MNVDLIFQIAGVGIIVAVLNQLLTRAGRDEQALLTTIAGLVAVSYTHLDVYKRQKKLNAWVLKLFV